jgi:hypothetical protein
MTDITASVAIFAPSTTGGDPWQTTHAPEVIEVTNDTKVLFKSLNMMYLK